MHELLACEYKGTARGVVFDLRLTLEGHTMHTNERSLLHPRKRELCGTFSALLAAVANMETQTFEELRANVLAVCALVDIHVEETP